MPKYEITFTHDPLTLERVQEGNLHRVTLTGDRRKVLYEGKDVREATDIYDAVVEHYEARKTARGVLSEREADASEQAIKMVNTTRPNWRDEKGRV